MRIKINLSISVLDILLKSLEKSKVRINLLLIVILLNLVSCKDKFAVVEICPPFSNGITSRYTSPIWHPDGEVIGFNHRPLLKIEYSYGIDCPFQASYYTNYDSIGFWLVNADGTNKRRILAHQLTTPAWSPDGKWIAFSSGAQIFKMPFDGEAFDTLAIEQVTFTGRMFSPSWNSAMDKFAYRQSICNDTICGLWIQNTITNAIENTIKYISYSSWYPHSDSILYMKGSIAENGSLTGDSLWVYSVNEDKTNFLRFIGFPYINNEELKYNNDGSKIGFISNSGEGDPVELFIMEGDGSGIKKITPDGASEFDWSPDGKRLVYVKFDYFRVDEQRGALWTIDPDGSNDEQLTFNKFELIK